MHVYKHAGLSCRDVSSPTDMSQHDFSVPNAWAK